MVIFDKRVGDTQDFDISFVNRLNKLSDTGASFTITVDSGITVISSALSSGVIKVWLSGGTIGTLYNISVVLTTTGVRVWTYSIGVKVKE